MSYPVRGRTHNASDRPSPGRRESRRGGVRRGFLLRVAGDVPSMTDLQAEVARRRTFAIISHPDAGKTTLTEKLLLYGGAIQLAGSVRARKNQRHATSDWMAMKQQRGISITSTVLQFPY